MKNNKIKNSLIFFILFYFCSITFASDFTPPYLKNFKDNPIIKSGKNWKVINPKGIPVPYGMKKEIFLEPRR